MSELLLVVFFLTTKNNTFMCAAEAVIDTFLLNELLKGEWKHLISYTMLNRKPLQPQRAATHSLC